MTHNYFLKCPICGVVTRMRTPVGYVSKTPVRIHCGSCDTLLTGVFVVDNSKLKYQFVPANCQEVFPQKFEYFGEASGEMICSKVVKVCEKNDVFDLPLGRESPVFDFMSSIPEEDRIHFINYVCYISEVSEHWDICRIKYDLFLKGKKDLLIEKYRNNANRFGCQLESDIGVYQFVYRSLFYDLGGLFKKNELENLLRKINYHFSHMDQLKLEEYLAEMKKKDRLQLIQEKIFNILNDYVRVVPYLIPAIGVLHYTDPQKIDHKEKGISTCSFEDIKKFYQDIYENLIDCCDVVVALDNIECRGDMNTFVNNLNLKKFREQSKGNRIAFLNQSEFFKGMFNLPVSSSSIRNAIGHSDYKYDGTSQSINFPEKSGSSNTLSVPLLDVVLECCKMMRSTCILAFIMYELFRYDMRVNGTCLPMHPVMYKRVRGQSRCPCGSGRKYKDCCKPTIVILEKNKISPDYPMKAEFGP